LVITADLVADPFQAARVAAALVQAAEQAAKHALSGEPKSLRIVVLILGVAKHLGWWKVFVC